MGQINQSAYSTTVASKKGFTAANIKIQEDKFASIPSFALTNDGRN